MGSKSNRLRLSDVRGVMNLVGECQELWADPDAWRGHLVRGLCRLTRQAVGHYMETTGPWPEAPHVVPRVVAAVECGWRDDAARSFYLKAQAEMAKAYEVMPGTLRLLERGRASGHAAATRHELCDDREWYGAWAVSDLRLPAHNDGHALSVVFDRRRSVVGLLSVNQDTDDPAPTVRTRRALALVHRTIAPLIGTRLATEGQASLKGLTPRLRQTLERLLAGDSEKQVAAALRVTPATAHEYVGRLYAHFGVGSRGELMAYFLHRTPRTMVNA